MLLGRLRRSLALGAILMAMLVALPNASAPQADTALVKVNTARGIDHPAKVIWVLALGSDARPGEPVTRSRADAIQLVGVNLDTGDGAIFGVPRDSWVSIPGQGANRVNAALYFGGPPLMAKTVGGMFGIDIDYVFVTGFSGFERMVRSIGGVTVNSSMAFSDDNLEGHYKVGRNRVNGARALNFGRMRHFLPRGDFDRSAHQSELVRAIAREVDKREDRPGFMERGMLSAIENLHTNLSPVELYRFAQAATDIRPSRIRSCVLQGSIGDVGGASVVFPDLRQARRVGADARQDAKLDGSC